MIIIFETMVTHASWTMVRKKGRAKTTENSEGLLLKSGGLAVAAAAAKAKQQSQTVEESFYRFQQRDKRRNGESITGFFGERVVHFLQQ
jgi:hypothetical protein